MRSIRCLPYILKQIVRHRVRSVLTIAGVAIAMFLFASVQTMNRSVTLATSASAPDTTLVMYRKDRYGPATANCRRIISEGSRESKGSSAPRR